MTLATRDRHTISKYLSRYAEPTAKWAAALPRSRYRGAVVLPAFDESSEFLERLLRLELQGRFLLVLVINAPSCATTSARQRTFDLLQAILRRTGARRAEGPLYWSTAPSPSSLDCLVIDALGPELVLRKKEGVGRARKMGADAALSLYSRGDIDCSFLGFTDADAILDEEYFRALARTYPEEPCGLSFPYRHLATGEPRVDEAMWHVEAGFRHYVLGLHRAGSPYAYHSLGSALAVSYLRYAQVRGVPNRQAGEDFHLLNKLVKLAPLRRLTHPHVTLLSRCSSRVPFGTGPSLQTALGQEDGARLLRDPEVFAQLGQFLQLMSASLLQGRSVLQSADGRLPGWLLTELEACHGALEGALSECPSPSHRMQRFHETFDALATLQFIHRREGAGGVRALDSWRALEPWGLVREQPALALHRLRRLEDGLPLLQGPTLLRSGPDRGLDGAGAEGDPVLQASQPLGWPLCGD